MKKSYLILLPFLMVSTLAGCGGNTSSTKKDYYLVDFNYNNVKNDGVYTSTVVYPGQTLEAPNEPNVENYVFEGWYSDKECTKEYKRFGLEIDRDFTLYAKWSDFKTLDVSESMARFSTELDRLASNAKRVIETLSATFAYPSLSEQLFAVEDRYDYRRYKDIMTKEYSALEENNQYVAYGMEQYFYTEYLFCTVYKAYDESTRDDSSTSVFDKNKVESFLSIDFDNFFSQCRVNVPAYIKSGKYDKDTLQYEFTGNYTTLRNNPKNYSWNETYMVANYSDSIGTWVADYYDYQYAIVIENGKISSANIRNSHTNVIGDEVQFMNDEIHTMDFFYAYDEGFEDFTGNRFSA